jgi:protein TonB
MSTAQVTADETNPFTAHAEADAPVKDRLTTTLFLAALFHGIVILGVSFSAPFREQADVPTLEVLLLPDDLASETENSRAFYVAQRNQRGSGTTDEDVRAATPPATPLPTELLGQLDGDGFELKKGDEGRPATELIATRSQRTEVSYFDGAVSSDDRSETPMAADASQEAVLASAAVEDQIRLRGERILEVTPDTRESRIAPYLDSWRRKVERLGTLHYPNEARRRGLKGNPVLEVAINADGSLADIRIRRSSGHPEIDQAALGILRLASPFDPFPTSLRAQYDELRFAYEWQFVQGASRGTVRIDRDVVR